VALGVSAAARGRALRWGPITAVAAVAATIMAGWRFRPFAVDPSLGYYLAHLSDLSPNMLISLAVVAVLGFYLGIGRQRRAADRSSDGR
jgi:hypothetical protein